MDAASNSFANQPDMELENDIEGEQFIVRFPRKTENV